MNRKLELPRENKRQDQENKAVTQKIEQLKQGQKQKDASKTPNKK
jgi:hypothetical protein